ncbi:alpha-ketoacid dehydrogenase subunit alpha/beta [Salinarimonas ramus]|uniref:2-oxoglutarate dehydrogenase E1 component n=1 Tax=Salinarimonas ramus TaxID=690164 RepID=A0A917V2B6_9HYPH|nr:dehydrogenase E1 component subunit alpha/beta [Salinarimonas ramus]GGK20492.1 2-oxoisovalerate dehydrogenase E1 [Salinarimonas ramus]
MNFETKPIDGSAALDTAFLERAWRSLNRVRRFDERVIELFNEGLVKGTAHSCVGQEAIAVGACAALEREDYIVSHHRGHGHCLAKGADLDGMMAELLGRDTGYCRGLGGSMHIADLELGILGANGVVGAGIGLGTGAALSAKIRRSGQVCLVFFGDGAANEGIFHEALNMASLWKLPVIYLCENNQFGLSTAMSESTAIDRIAKRAAGYSMPGETIDGNDVGAVHEATRRAVARARAGEGPSLIEALTWRWGDHSMRANLPRYRSAEDEDAWRARNDPLARVRRLLEERQVRPEALAAAVAEEDAAIERAVEAAKVAPEPTIDILDDAVAAPARLEGASEPGPKARSARTISYVEAIREAIDQAMEEDERVFVIGEDVGKIGGIFGCTRGLLDKFGPERLRDAPISENAIANAAVGAAITGLRPIAEVQIFDFVTLMMDAIVNQAAKFRFMLGGKPRVPLVIRGPQGGGIRLGAQHSQSLETWFTHIPGLVVLAPSTPYDAKGLLMAAIRDDNPVVFLEHKLLYVQGMGTVPAEPYAIPIGKAEIKREGRHATLVATMAMVMPALAAARELSREGIEVEVIDPRSLAPLDLDTIVASVRKTNRLVVAHEGWTRHGFGAEIAAAVTEAAFDHLDAPVARVGMRATPMPYNDTLERAVIPSQADIVAALRRVLYREEA